MDDPSSPEFGSADGSRTYDIAFALVWAEGDESSNVNEAHAYASCSNCVTVAVGFQVILIMDDAQVVVPQNLAVAANYDCYQCITAAIASQLVPSVEEQPGEEEPLALSDVWGRLTEFASTITSLSLTEITEQLEIFKAEIVAILGDATTVPLEPDPSATTSTTAPTAAVSDSSSPSPTTTSPSPAPEETTTTSPSPAPVESTSPTTSSTTTEASPTTSPSP